MIRNVKFIVEMDQDAAENRYPDPSIRDYAAIWDLDKQFPAQEFPRH